MKQIPLLQGKVLLIELPEGAYGFRVFKDEQPYISYWIKTYIGRVNLPPSNWRIIGMLSEVTESDASGLVDSDDQYGVTMYRNYKTTGMPYYDEQITALESLDSAIVAEGYTFQSTPKPENKDFYWGYLDDLAKWEAAQSRVLCRERCLVLRRADND